MDAVVNTGANKTIAVEPNDDGGCSREELEVLLQEGLDSGLSDRSWDEIIRDLNVQHFGKDSI